MTILSTDLKALKRRGYNGATLPPPIVFLRWLTAWLSSLVDRILRQQNAEREAAEKAMREARSKLVSRPDMTAKEAQPQPKISLAPTGGTGGAIAPVQPYTTPEQTSERPTSAMNELERLLRPNPGTSKRDESPPPYPAIPGGVSQPEPSRRLVRSPQPGHTVTPLSNIGTFCECDTGVTSHAPSSTSQQH
jgi:hypothetical protein